MSMDDNYITKKRKLNEDNDKNNTVIRIKLSDLMSNPLPDDDPSKSNSNSSYQKEDESLSQSSLISNPNENKPMMDNLDNPHSFDDEKRDEISESEDNILKSEEKHIKERRDIFEKIDEDLNGANEKNENINNIENNDNKSKWKKKPPPKNNNLLHDFVADPISHEEMLKISLARAAQFNEYVLLGKRGLQQRSKQLETQKIIQRFNLDSSNSIFPSPYIPLIRYTENGEVYYDANGNIELEKDSVERFINLNVTNEHYNFSNDQSSRFAMFCPRKFPRRRRRRRNGIKPPPETNSNEN